jgi:hypothetical protein
MKLAWPFVNKTEAPLPTYDEEGRQQIYVPFDQPGRDLGGRVSLDTCSPFEALFVTTKKNVYEIVVLSGRSGEVLVRGGRLFPNFQRAILLGSTAGGSALKMRCIEADLNVELSSDGKVIRTSRVQSVVRAGAYS